MLEAAINWLYISAAAVLQFTLIPTIDVQPPALHEVAQAEYKALSYIWNDVYPCRFHGVVIPVERDWEETVDNGYVTTVLPPEPGKIHTYALLVNKKTCPGKEAEPMLVISQFNGSFLNRGLPKGIQILFLSPDKDVAKQPKWLPQALTALQAAADKGNQVAKDFIAYTESAKGSKAAPEANAKAD